jgi:protein TonB
LGWGSGAPGPPDQTVLRTNRLAKPIQSVRPVYPPLALKMGMQGDVTLKIIVDAQGNVSRAEIVKSGGAEFDEEALKAVKQSRFEPAQRDGQNVPAEFTYIYKFRLRR